MSAHLQLRIYLVLIPAQHDKRRHVNPSTASLIFEISSCVKTPQWLEELFYFLPLPILD